MKDNASKKVIDVFGEDFMIKHNVKRGLRNADGTGVVAGVTRISNVHGYIIDEFERIPADGKLYFRGYDVADLVSAAQAEDRFGYEEIAYLLVKGELPTKAQLADFCALLETARDLPNGFIEDMIMKAASPNIMNKLERNVLSLYSYDANAEDIGLDNVYRQCISVMAKLPMCMAAAYQTKRRVYDNESFFLHYPLQGLSASENILSMIRADRKYTHEEAMLLDKCMMLHAEHGGGNNSTFAVRCLTSSGTDTYSALAAGIGALKGFRHGGANIKAYNQLLELKAAVKDPYDDAATTAYLKKVVAKEAGDGTGLVYGIGHAVYTLSDPRCQLIKAEAEKMSKIKGYEDDFYRLTAIERIAPELIAAKTGADYPPCANIDLYSGLVYTMLGITTDLFTPLFAIARMAGWCAHRLEEMQTCHRIMRPAYQPAEHTRPYVSIIER